MNADIDVCIYECPASLYLMPQKKWVSGIFVVSVEGLCFDCQETQTRQDSETFCFLNFEEIVDAQKEITTFIFPCITLMTATKKFWLASFPNRDSAFTMIEHFWKQRLLSKSKNLQGGIDSSMNKTELGKELLQIAHDSSVTMISSARTLHSQGQQLQSAELTAEMIHGELTMAESMLTRLESWFGQWSIPSDSIKDAAVPEKNQPIAYPMVFSRNGPIPDVKCKQEPGTLLLSVDGLSLLDAKKNVIKHFKRSEISSIHIKSPWEMMLLRRMLGSKDICFYVMSAQLSMALGPLQRLFRDRVTFDNPAESKQRKPQPCKNPKPKSTGQIPGERDSLASGFPESQFSTQREEIVSDTEAEQLQQLIHAMKSVAADIGVEQDDQLTRIDRLVASTDRAGGRIQEDIQRMKHLM